jgi:hypothetical protein
LPPVYAGLRDKPSGSFVARRASAGYPETELPL